MAELADALDLGSSGRPWGFKSLYPHQKTLVQFEREFFIQAKGLVRVYICLTSASVSNLTF